MNELSNLLPMFRKIRIWHALLIFAALALVYVLVLWPWLTYWGATPEEISRPMPGDEYLNASETGTRAITIQAPPEVVWQWLVQIGADRAAFYSHDWLENLVFVNYHNADEIHPEWQELLPGRLVRGVRPEYLWGAAGPAVGWVSHVYEPGRLMYLWGPVLLEPSGKEATRVTVRSPLKEGSLASRAFGVMWYDPMHFVMERGFLIGLRDRAENRVRVTGLGWLGLAGWMAFAALLAMAWMDLPGRRRWLLALPVVFLALALITSGDLKAGLAWFLMLGIPLYGFLRFGRRFLPSFLLIAAAVLLILLLIPNSFSIFGLVFLAAAVTWMDAEKSILPQLNTNRR